MSVGSSSVHLSRKPTVLIFVGYHLPGFKGGGIISCVANIVNHLQHDFGS
jgi:hypothetical protein